MVNLVLFGDKLSNSLFSKCIHYGAFSRRFIEKIELLKLTAANNKVRQMAANQLNFEQSLLVLLSPSSKILPSEYKVCINPKIQKISNETIECIEESISFPHFQATVTRYKQIYVQYDDKKGKSHEEELKGLEACWFQQALDQTLGIPCISWLACKGNLIIKPQYLNQANENPEFIKAFEQYKQEGQNQIYKERDLYGLNSHDDRDDYAMQGPTHKPPNNELYEELLRKLEIELFYTF